MDRRRLPIIAVIITMAAAEFVTGCAAGPAFQPFGPPSVDRYTATPLPGTTAGPRQTLLIDGRIPAHWWTLFNSPALDAFEDEALRANPDLEGAEAALRQARELYLAQRGTLFPQVDFAGAGTRNRTSSTIAPVLSNNAKAYTLYQAQLNLSYDLDAFGGLRRQVESAAAQAEVQKFQTEAAYLSLTTNVANAVVQLAGLQAQLDAANKIIAAEHRTLEVTRREQALGEASSVDSANVEVALEQAEQLAPQLQKQIDGQRDMLAVFTGRTSADAPTARIALADLTLPGELPVSLPSNLVRQRPDVLAAEANVHAASAQVGVAIAARLPNFAVTGQLGGASSSLGTLLAPGNIFWLVTGTIAQSMFDAGQLRHRQKAAEAALDQAKDQYRSTVLAALQGMADVLQGIVADAEADRHAIAVVDAAAHLAMLARSQSDHGETGVLPLLAAQTALDQAEVTLAQTHTARYADTVALFQALGGGWWNEPARTADVAR
jgi:NodT family efflux transporter outer membrane factor (OMF) lipoprotein